jgi:phage tail sheath gpL-like
MRPIPKTSALITFALCLAAGPAGACDPEDLKAEYRNLCATPTDAIATLVAATAGKLKPEMATLLASKAKEAQDLCLADKYDDAMKLAVRVAKALGSAEQEHGLPRERLTAVPGNAATRVAAR